MSVVDQTVQDGIGQGASPMLAYQCSMGNWLVTIWVDILSQATPLQKTIAAEMGDCISLSAHRSRATCACIGLDKLETVKCVSGPEATDTHCSAFR